MAFNPAEIAQLQVAGVSFQDWETVWIQHRWSDGWPLFRFTAAENATMPISWIQLQFKPGDLATIWLGGQLAITGIILTRQTSYDANNHGVELSGVGRTWAAGESSVDTKDANQDNKALMDIASLLYGKHGVAVLPVGSVDSSPFKECQLHPGEKIFDCVDRLSRQKGATLGSDHLGNMLMIGEHSNPVVQDLVEGENILKMQCIISDEMLSKKYDITGQAGNAENLTPAQASEIRGSAPGTMAVYDKFKLIVAEQALTQAEAETRAYYESRFCEGTNVKAFVTVQGWLRDGVNLWRCGDDVYVMSPMAMLNGITLKIQTATFQQDNASGTTTVLELVLPWMLADKPFGVDYDTPQTPQTDGTTPNPNPPPPAPAVDGTQPQPVPAPAPPISH